ncbi:MAG: NusG domain II-containing protein [Clostridia bacterium]|nr:NusG domain II-containing protein [Clostridia bacterium]
MFKKGDIIVFICILAAGIALIILTLIKTQGKTVVITENGNEVYTGSLYFNKEVELRGNTVVIKSGRAFVSKADCKNQICVNSPEISKKGETIVCLPNKVIVEVK